MERRARVDEQMHWGEDRTVLIFETLRPSNPKGLLFRAILYIKFFSRTFWYILGKEKGEEAFLVKNHRPTAVFSGAQFLITPGNLCPG